MKTSIKNFVLLIIILLNLLTKELKSQNAFSFPSNMSEFAIVSGSDLVTNSQIIASGKIGATTSITGDFLSDNSPIIGGSGIDAVIDSLTYLMDTLIQLSGDTLSVNIDGQTIGTGIHYIYGDVYLNTNLTLTGSPTDQIVFNVDGNLIVDQNFILNNNSNYVHNIIWNVTGGIQINGMTNFKGVLLSKNSISFNGVSGSYLAVYSLQKIEFADCIASQMVIASILNWQNSYSNLSCNIPVFNCNLIQNGSFEFYSNLPNMLTQIANACAWQSASTITTPDYFHNQSSSLVVGIPQNIYGTEFTHSGNAYSGIVNYIQPSNGVPWREYIQSQLYQSLTAGTYYAEMYVALSEYSDMSMNNLGMYFSSTAPSTAQTTPLLLSPQVESIANLSSCTWTKISGCFTSVSGGENYVTIGNFRSEASTNYSTSNCYVTSNIPSESYYYIDDISLFKMPAISNHVEYACEGYIVLGPVICSNAFSNMITYSWSPAIYLDFTNIANPSANFINTGITTIHQQYTLTMTINGDPNCTVVDYVDVYFPPTVTITSSGSICFNSSQLTASNVSSALSYTWTTPSGGSAIGQTINANQPGTYTVSVSMGNGCIETATYTVLMPTIGVSISGPSLIPCQPHTITLQAQPVGISGVYSWSSGATTQSIAVTSPGTYQVTYSVGSCSTSSSISVSNATGPSITLTPSTALSCGFPPAFLTANCPTCTSITGTQGYVSPTTTTTYTVTGTNAYNCTATAQSTVYTFDPHLYKPVIVGAESNCENNGSHSYTYTISNWNPALASYYTWTAINSTTTNTPATISLNGSTQSATITWFSNKGGTITVTMGVNNCLVSTNFYVQDCCQADPPGITLKDGNNVDNITSGTFTAQSGMVFNGTFFVNRDFEFRSGCGILGFGPGARIVVMPGVTLTIDGCFLRPGNKCCSMWKGIELQQSSAGAASIIFTNNEIYQAVNAITIPVGTRYTLNNSKFIDNYVGLNITGTPGSNVLMSNLQFNSTQFICSPSAIFNNFADPYLGQTLLPGTYGYAGMQVNNCTNLDIGNWLQTLNGNIHFYNLANGIIYANSNVRIWNCTFKHMKYDVHYPTANTTKNNCAVNGTGGSIRFTGLGGLSSSPNTIEDCKYGLALSRTRGELTRIKTAYNVIRDIHETYCSQIDIHENYLRATTVNIYCYGNMYNRGMVIYDNEMRLGGSALFGTNIELIEFSINPHIIKDNQIYVNVGRRGINALGVRGATIQHNYLQLNHSFSTECIYMNNCRDNFVLCNTAEAISTPSGLMQSGIYLNASQSNTVADNEVDKVNLGFRFNVGCNNTIWKGNKMHDHDYGLYFDPSGEFGQQPQISGLNNGNLWLGTYNILGAFINPANGTQAALNRIFYNSGSTNTHPSSNDPGGISPWFFSNTDPDYTSPSSCIPLATPSDYFESEDEINAQMSYTGSGDPASNYCNDRFLFKKLEEDPSLMANNPILQAFFNQNLYGNIGLFTNVEVKIEDAVKWDALYQMTYIGNENLKLSKLDSIEIVDSLLIVDPQNQLTYQPIRDGLIESIANIDQSNEIILSIISQVNEYRIANSENDNSSLIDNSAYEQNEIVVNEIYLATIAREIFELSPSQISDLEQIIDQCPLIGGPAVFKARALYRMFDQDIYWDDDLICPANGVSPRLAANKHEPIMFNVFPNPASNKLFLTYEISTEADAEFVVYNIFGEELIRQRLNSKVQNSTIDISSLSSNLYIYKIVVDDTTVKEEKISVIK